MARIESTTGRTANPSRKESVWSLVAGGVATVWMLALTSWLSGGADAPVTTRINVLFHSDSANWVSQMTEEKPKEARVSNKIAHPLDARLWRFPIRTLSRPASLLLPERQAGVLSTRLIVAMIFGLGVAALVFHALSKSVPFTYCLLLLPAYFMFSSHMIASLPEHYGISNGLLSTSYVLGDMIVPVLPRLSLLALAGLLIGGTTITNSLFVIGSGATKLVSSPRIIAICLILVLGGAFGALYYFSHSSKGLTLAGDLLNEERRGVKWFAKKYLNDRLFTEPASAAAYVGLSFVYPAIAPEPGTGSVFKGEYQMVTHEPWSIKRYDWRTGLSAVAWLTLLGSSVFFALRDRETAVLALLLLSWILFNALLHTMWGDEMFLYSPHWSWCLFALVLLGVKRMPVSLVASIVVVMLIGQVSTLLQTRALLAMIPT